MHMIPATIEGVAKSVVDGLPTVSEYTKKGLRPVRCDMIYNSTHNIVELYDGDNWLALSPNRRINVLPDSVVSTTGAVITEDGDMELKLTSVCSSETLGNHKVTLV